MKTKISSFAFALAVMSLCVSCSKPATQDIYINPYKSGYSDLKASDNNKIKIFNKELNPDKGVKGRFKIEFVETDDSTLITPILNDYKSTLNYDFLSFENRNADGISMAYAAEISTEQGNVYYSISHDNYSLYLDSDKGMYSRSDQEFKEQLTNIKNAFDSKETKNSFYTDSYGFGEKFY